MTPTPDLGDPAPLLEDVVAAPTDQLCLFDAEGRYRYVSRSLEESLGVRPDELIGRYLEELPLPGAGERQLDRLRQEVQRTGNVLGASSDPVGESRRVDYLFSPFRRDGRSDGPVLGVVCSVRPVSERPCRQGPENDPLARFHRAFANAPIGMGVATPDGRWIEVNGALCTLLGRSRASLLTETLDDLTWPEDRYCDFAYLRQLLDGEITSYQIEKRFWHAQGHPVWTVLAVSALREPDGRPCHLIVQAQDISARKDIESQARLLADLVECSAEAISARDERGRVIYWNQAAERLFGFAATEILGSPISLVLPPNRLAEAAQNLAIAAAGEPVGPLDTVQRHKDGHDIDVSLTISPIFGLDGQLVGFASVARDITERRRREAELEAAHVELEARAAALERANADLRRSNEDLQQFAHAASHDLSEPLRTISGFTQLLVEGYEGRLDEDADTFLGFIGEAAARMRHLLDGLLAVSQLSTRARHDTPVRLDDVVHEALGHLHRQITETEARIEIGDLPSVHGDPAQLVQAIENVVANSLKFRRPDQVPVVRVEAEERADSVVVRVDDNGVGIEPRHRDRVFQMFARLNRRDDYEGTGVGLALVKRIVDRHHGAVDITDSPLGGTRVSLTLPVGPTPPD